MGAPVSHIGGYGIPAIPTQPATAMFSHRIHRIHRSLLPRRNSHRFVGGYGIPAIPMHPVTVMFSHRFHGFTQMVRLRSGLPQNTQNSQKFITEKKLPQICRRVWHPCHTHAPCYSNVLPQISLIYTDGWLRSGLPQNTQNSQKFIAEKKLPQISRIYTLSLQKKAIRLNNQGKTMIAKDSFVPLL